MKIKVSKYVGSKLDGLRKKDFEIKMFRGSGPGGQHRNKVETAVRITHKSTGISAEATDSKSQITNRQSSFIKLAKKLIVHYGAEERELSPDRERVTEVVRTYHAIRGTVKDYRTGLVAPYKEVMDGKIDCFMI